MRVRRKIRKKVRSVVTRPHSRSPRGENARKRRPRVKRYKRSLPDPSSYPRPRGSAKK